jgi:hypothetical protein
MNGDERRSVDVFLYGLTLLNVEDDGLALGHDLGDLDFLAGLCGVIRLITARGIERLAGQPAAVVRAAPAA